MKIQQNIKIFPSGGLIRASLGYRSFKKASLTSSVVSSVALSSLVSAIERPADLDEKPLPAIEAAENEPKQALIRPLEEEEVLKLEEELALGKQEKAFEVPVGDKPKGVIEIDPNEKKQPLQLRPYFGVGGVPIGEALAEHLDLDSGLVVKQIYPGSGADKAGLQVNDILLTFDELALRTNVDLRNAVARHEVGGEAKFTFLRKGEVRQGSVTLEARPQELSQRPKAGNQNLGIHEPLVPGWPNLADGNMPEVAKKHLEEMQRHIDEQFNDLGLGLKLNQLFDGQMPDGGGKLDLQLNASTSVTMSDEAGTITMESQGEQVEVVVTDRAGNILYDGPWSSPQDKAAVEPEIRERIERLGMMEPGKKQLRLWMDPGQ